MLFFKPSFPLASHDRRTAACFWVTAALLVYAPLTVLMLYIAFLPFMLIYGWGIRKPMRRYGEQEQQARREQSRLVTETMKGYAELELNAAFPFLQQAFAQKVRKSVRAV